MPRRRRDAGRQGPGSATFVVGVHPVLEALKAGRVEQVLLSRAAGAATQRLQAAALEEGVPLREVPTAELDQRAGTDRHQGVLAHLDLNEVELADVSDLLARAEHRGEEPLIVLLDGIQDPMNFGAIVRSAHALGAHGVVIPKNRAAQVTPTVVRASAGAILHVAVARVVNLKHAVEDLREAGVRVVAAAAEGAPADTVDLSGGLGVIVGGEGKGVRPLLVSKCDATVSIPQLPDFDSLNASVAAGILLYEVQRQRRLPAAASSAFGKA